MFTGIVEEVGSVRSVESVGGGRRLVVAARRVLTDVSVGASLAVDGCCMTVTDFGDGWFAVDAVPETISRTTLGSAGQGDPVNLERPLAADGRFGGHIVQGHVDAVAEVVTVKSQTDGSRRLAFRHPASLAGQIVEKGSVTLDGVSLTVAGLDSAPNAAGGAVFHVALVPHTLEVTTFGGRVSGDRVNVEADVLARYVAGLLTVRLPTSARALEGTG